MTQQPRPFTCVRRDQGIVVVVEVAGEVDFSNALELRTELLAAVSANPCVVVDLDGVAFIDSTGFGALVAASKQARVHGGLISLVRPSDPVRLRLIVTGLDTIFGIHPSVEAAIDAAGRHLG